MRFFADALASSSQAVRARPTVLVALLAITTAASGPTSLPAQEYAAFARPVSQGALAPGEKAERRLDSLASHAWALELKADYLVEVEVLQRGADVAVRVYAPGGRPHREVDAVRGTRGTERARWIADADGRWTVALASVRAAPTPGTEAAAYEIRWVTHRLAAEADRQILAADSLRRVALELDRQGRFPEADSALRRALELRERAVGPDHADVVRSLNDLAQLYARRRHYADAESLYKRVLAIRERTLGPEHSDVAWSLTELGILLKNQRRYAEAESLYKRALAIWEKALGPEHSSVAAGLTNLGSLYAEQNRVAEAEPVRRRALAIWEKVLAPDHPNVAVALTALGNLLNEQGRVAEAEPFLRRALTIWEKIRGPEHPDLAAGLTNLANVYRRQHRYADAESLYRRGLAIREKARGPEHAEVATSLTFLGNLYLDQARYEEAEPLYRRALGIWEKPLAPDHANVVVGLRNLANVYFHQSRYAEAEPLYRRALAIRETALGPDHPEVATNLTSLAHVFYSQGRHAEAEPLYRRAILIREKALGAAHPDLAKSLNNLGNLYETQGQYAVAELLYRRAHPILEKVLGPEHLDVARSLSLLAYLYYHQGRHAEAEPLFRRALTIREKALGAEHRDVAQSANTLAMVLEAQGRHADAEPLFRRALAIDEKAFGPRHPNVARSLNSLGRLHARRGRHAQAEALFRRALAIQETAIGTDHPQVAVTLTNLAESIWSRGGSVGTVRPVLDRAIGIFDARPPYPEDRIRAYTLRARVERRRGEHRRALADLAEAIRSAEELRPQVGGDEETRATYFGRFVEQFDLMVAWHVRDGDLARALEYAERGRARVLLDQLAAGKIDLRQSIPPDVRAPLEARETSARARLAELQQRLTLLAARGDSSALGRRSQSTALEDSLRAAEREFREVYEGLKNASPLWRDLLTSGGQPVTLAAIQRRLVPDRSVMLLYQVGAEASFVLVVPPASEAPEGVALQIGPAEAAALGVKAGALTAAALERVAAGADPTGTGASLAGVLGQAPSRGLRTSALAVSVARLHALRRVLVPDAVWRRIRAAEEVVIVPGRGLHGLPFEALVVETGATPLSARYWLDEGPALRYVPSATTLYTLEQRPAARPVPSVANAIVLSLSEPAFDPMRPASPPQAGAAEPLPPASAAERVLTRNSYTRLGGTLSPLPGTGAETDAIRRAFGADSNPGAVMVLQRREATEAMLRPALAGKRYLHLATHGLVDERRGALFAALALTPPTTERATADDDGFLQLHEIYELKLIDVELAVLSACETNIGTTVGSEGVFALSRGFLTAGARRVIASQWAVEDRSTAALVGHFFQDIAAAEREGRQPDYAASLRAAKRTVRQQAQWAHPYYWAPFVLTGAR